MGHQHGFGCIDSKGTLQCGIDSMRERLSRLESVRMKTHGDEKSIELLKKRLAADPSKFRVGFGVSYQVAGGRKVQTNRGFRIVDLDVESLQALVRCVADTGLTSSGGNDDQISDHWRPLGDLKRDKKYDSAVLSAAPSIASAPTRREKPPVRRVSKSPAKIATAPAPAPMRQQVVGELARASSFLHNLDKLPLIVQCNTAFHHPRLGPLPESWSFIGHVPMHLSYRMLDGSPVPAKLAQDIKSFGPGLFKAHIRLVLFPTRAAAIAEAERLGYSVKG